MADPVLHVADVRKKYGRTRAVNGVTLDVYAGECFGLLGPNGAGKTTLLSIVAGLLDADSGEIRLAGERFRRSDRSQRRRVGIGTQDLAVYPDLTARENLVFFGKLYGLGGDPLSKRVDELLGSVGLSDRAGHRAGTFSGGMKRRLNLAVAVVHSPILLLLDEPTTGVDPQSRNHIFEMVRRLNLAGMTIIYTSHYMEEVQALCPRIAVLDAGVVKACDTLPNLLRTLSAGLKLDVPNAPPDLRDRLAGLPGVTAVSMSGDRFSLKANSLGPLLPHVAEACRACGAFPTSMTVDEPTLEKVFLHLTGHGLRD